MSLNTRYVHEGCGATLRSASPRAAASISLSGVRPGVGSRARSSRPEDLIPSQLGTGLSWRWRIDRRPAPGSSIAGGCQPGTAEIRGDIVQSLDVEWSALSAEAAGNEVVKPDDGEGGPR